MELLCSESIWERVYNSTASSYSVVLSQRPHTSSRDMTIFSISTIAFGKGTIITRLIDDNCDTLSLISFQKRK